MRPGQRDLFASLLPELRIDLPEEGRLDPQRLFPAPPAELWLEIGFGAGEHLAEQAAALPDASLGRVFILFPDPWPKARHHKRRMVSPGTLDQLARTMKTGAELRLATDDIGYLRAMLELVPMHPAFAWEARGPADWLRRPADWPATRYEAKAVAAGRIPHFLRCTRKPR